MNGKITNPLSLNRYVYGLNNPVNYKDPTGQIPVPSWIDDSEDIVKGARKLYKDSAVKLAQAYLLEMGYDIGPPGIDGLSVEPYETWQAIKQFQEKTGLNATGHINGFNDATITKMEEVIKDWDKYQHVYAYNPNIVNNNDYLVNPSVIKDYIDKHSSLTQKQIGALYMINNYANKTPLKEHYIDGSSSDPLVFFFEGAGSGMDVELIGYPNEVLNDNIAKGLVYKKEIYDYKTKENKTHYYEKSRYNALAVVVKNGEIVYATPNASSLPDKPGEPHEGSPYKNVVIEEGIYNISSSTYKGEEKYAALSVTETWRPEKEYNDGNGKVDVTYLSEGFENVKLANGIMIHFTYGADYYTAETSLSCLTVENYTTGDYTKFGHAVGFLAENSRVERHYYETDKRVSKGDLIKISGYLIVNRDLDN